MLNKNVGILLGVIILVASFNMISIVLILIMERTQMIGLLKAFGAKDVQIRRIFMYTGMRLIWKGLLLGNIIGLGIAWLQYQFKIIPLDPENYYMTFVPIAWDWTTVILLNVGTFIVISLVLLIPTLIISRIQPIKSIRFD
jgi:lipoprotein-releasing system permease protein